MSYNNKEFLKLIKCFHDIFLHIIFKMTQMTIAHNNDFCHRIFLGLIYLDALLNGPFRWKFMIFIKLTVDIYVFSFFITTNFDTRFSWWEFRFLYILVTLIERFVQVVNYV